MQCGGNANATQFFKQYESTSKDAHQKYNSRAAQLYKDKLASIASSAMRQYGTELFIPASLNPSSSATSNNSNSQSEKPKESAKADFWEEHNEPEDSEQKSAAKQPQIYRNDPLLSEQPRPVTESVNSSKLKVNFEEEPEDSTNYKPTVISSRKPNQPKKGVS